MAKIMVVDEEEGMQLLMNKILSKAGYEVANAVNGRDALEKLKTEKPDLVLLDILMPGMDGWETLREIRKDEATRDLPVVMVTVLTGEEYRQRSFAAGADAYVSKPIMVDKLLATVKWILQNVQRWRVGIGAGARRAAAAGERQKSVNAVPFFNRQAR